MRVVYNRHNIAIAVAAVLFLFASLVALGDATFKADAVLVPLGLFFLALGLF